MSWSGRRVLVTGAGGFIGSHLAERLVEEGAVVRAFVHYNALGSAGWLDSSPCRASIEVSAGDICDRDTVRRAVAGTEVIFHLAALIAIPYSYQAPLSFVRTNVEGTLNVMQAARDSEVGMVVHTSTSEVYGTARYVPIDEEHPLQGQSPYSASKIGGDKIAEACSRSFNVPLTTVRPFNTFGPRQSARAVIPTIISQCLKRDRIRLGDLSPTRDLNYVANTVDGFLLAAEQPTAVGEVINLGSGREVSIGDLTAAIQHVIGSELPIDCDEQRLRPAQSEVARLMADNTKARRLLGWQPEVGLEGGLRLTVDWIREHPERFRPDAYVI